MAVATTINITDYAGRKAQEAREAFKAVKMNATTKTELARVAACETYVEEVKAMSERVKYAYNPHPYKNFKWETCGVCRKEIMDDPYGHNPYPLAEDGHCCSRCNRLVIYTRMKSIMGHQARGMAFD
jgi:hypothetical protein